MRESRVEQGGKSLSGGGGLCGVLLPPRLHIAPAAVETWSGDITGTGTYSYDRIVNLTTGVRVVVNGFETIDNACVLGTCGGSLFYRDGTRMTCPRVISAWSRASGEEPAPSPRLTDRFESSTPSTSYSRAGSVSRGHCHRQERARSSGPFLLPAAVDAVPVAENPRPNRFQCRGSTRKSRGHDTAPSVAKRDRTRLASLR